MSLVALLGLLASPTLAPFSSAAPAPSQPHAWLHVLVLSGTFAGTREDLEALRDSADGAQPVATLVLHDGPDHGDALAYVARYCPSAARTREGCSDRGSMAVPLEHVGGARGEVDLGAPDTFAALLDHAAWTFAPEHVLLTLKGRSDFGWLLRDDDDDSGLSADALADVLASFAATRGRAIDVLVLAASASAGVETLARLPEVTLTVVATQASVADARLALFRPQVWSRMLRDNPAVDAVQLARAIALDYRDPSYAGFDAARDHAIVAIDTAAGPALVDRLAALAAALVHGGGHAINELEAAAAPAWHFGEQATRVDLGALLAGLAAGSADTTRADLARRAGTVLRNALLEEHSQPEEALAGLSIFFPADAAVLWSLADTYTARHVTWQARSGWGEVLAARLRKHREDAAGCAAQRSELAALIALLLAARRVARRRR